MRRIHLMSTAFAILLVPVLLILLVRGEASQLRKSLGLIRATESDPLLFSLGGGFDDSLSGVFRSVFPMDSVISYNVSNTTTHNFIARYASFSPILNHELRGQLATLPGDGCELPSADLDKGLHDKVLIVHRGDCSFVQKIENVLESELAPRAIIIANNVPLDELITMYHRNFNHDGAVKIPMLFMSFEDYDMLEQLRRPGLEVAISTVALDSIMGFSLLMALSPPMMFLLFYLMIRVMQHWRQRRVSALNERYVAQLPVFMYKGNHLIPCSNFYEYLKATNQTDDVPFALSSSEDLVVDEAEIPYNDSLVIGGTDLFSLKSLGLLFSGTDFYATLKCSICLGRLVPLHSRVIMLSCKHIFHEKCLSNWLINFKKSCPLCNRVLNLSNEHSSYGTFGSDLEAGSQEASTQNVLTASARGSSHASSQGNAPIPIDASYRSMPILPSHLHAQSATSSTASAFTYSTPRSQSIAVSSASAASDYLTATSVSSEDEYLTEVPQSERSASTLELA